LSSRQFLIDAASRHAVFVDSYSVGLEKRTAAKIRAIINQSAGMVADNSTTAEIREFLSQRIENFYGALSNELQDFANQEIEFSIEMISKAVRPSLIFPPQFDVLDTDMPDINLSVRQSLSQFGANKSAQILQTIADNQGKPEARIAAEVRNLVPLHMRQARALVRTVSNAGSSNGRLQSMAANSDLFAGYEWVSTLDSHTTIICMTRDGVLYPISKLSPKPPAHWSCRSTMVPRVKPQYDLGASIVGTRPSVGSRGAQKVNADTKYGGWVTKQTKPLPKKNLGVERGWLF